MRKLIATTLSALLMAAMLVVPSCAQYHRQDDYRNHQRFYDGASQAGRGGDYGYDRDHRYGDYDRRYHSGHGGIGPGKGALIGGAGGAVLGGLFSGSAKGALLGGAAGAGIGAILGQAAQNNRREERRY